MRTLLDVSVLISALLTQARPHGTVARIIRVALAGGYPLLLPEQVIAETLEAVVGHPYLAARITSDAVRTLIDQLRTVAIETPPLAAPTARVCRDPDDDYLLAHAFAGHADFLVTRDKDLLVLANEGFPFQIVTPAQFLVVLAEAGLA